MEREIKIKDLETKYFSLYEEKFGKDVCEKITYPELRLKVGDWIYCDFFKEANKVKSIKNDNVEFHFTEKNGIKSGVLSFVENRQNVKSHRYATLEEIEVRLNKEIDDIEYILTPVKPDDNVKQIFKHGDWATTPNSWVKYVNRFGSEVQVPEEIDYIGNHGKVYFTNRSVGACTRIKCIVKATDEELIDYFYYKNKIGFKEGDTVSFIGCNPPNLFTYKVNKFSLHRTESGEISDSDLIVSLESPDGIRYSYSSSNLEKCDSEGKRFNNLVTPLIKYMAENHSPHSVLIIDNTTATIYDGYKSHINDSFIVD